MRSALACLLVGGLVCLAAERAPAVAPPRVAVRIDAHGDPLPRFAFARLGTGRFRCGNVSAALALSPDGKFLATYGSTAGRDQIVLWDAATGREVRRFPLGATGNRLDFTPDGKELAATDHDNTVRFFDPVQGKELRQVAIRPAAGEVLALSGDGRLLATASSGFRRRSPVAVFEVRTGKPLARIEPASSGSVGLALSPDGKALATWGSEPGRGPGGPRFGRGGGSDEPVRSNPTVQLWDAVTGKESVKIDCGPGGSVVGVAFSPDRKTLALATSSGNVQLWPVAGGKRLRSWHGPAQRGRSADSFVLFSPDGKKLLVGDRGTAAPAAWDLGTGRRLRVAGPPPCRFHSAAFPADGRIIACGVQAQTVVLWDLLSGKRLSVVEGHQAAVGAVVFRPDERGLYSAGADGRLIEWDLAGKLLRYLPVPRTVPAPFRRSRFRSSEGNVVFSPGGAYLASGERFGSGLSVRDVQTAEEVFSVPRDTSRSSSGATAAVFSPDGKLFAVPSSDSRRNGIVRLIQVDSGEELPAWELEVSAASSLAFGPSGRRLAVVVSPPLNQTIEGRELRIWRVDLKRDDPDFKPFVLPASFKTTVPLAFSPEGNLLAAADSLGAVFLYSARTGKQVGHLGVGENIVRGPVFSPDGRCLAIASSRRDETGYTLSVWETSTGRRRWSIGMPAAVTALAFSPSSQVLATGHPDSTILLWDLSGRRTEQPAAGADRARELWEALASPDAEKAFAAQRLLAAGGDRTVAELRKRLRPSEERTLQQEALARLVKQLDDDEFQVRRQAFEALAGQGRAAEPHLRKALLGKPSVEVRRRVRELLARLDRLGLAPGEERPLRALEVLEWIATPAARQVITDLSRGAADAALTRQARAALRRLAR